MNNAIENPAHYLDGRTFGPTDVADDWHLCRHLSPVLKYISRAGRKDKNSASQDLKKARWFIVRKISNVLETWCDVGCPEDVANIDAQAVIEDWGLHPHLAGVVSVIYHRRTMDVDMLREALGFLEQRIRVLEV